MWEPYGPAAIPLAVRSRGVPARARDLTERANAVNIPEDQVQHFANALVSDTFDPQRRVVRAKRLEQLRSMNRKLEGSGLQFTRNDLPALLAMRSNLELIDAVQYRTLTGDTLGRLGRPTWERYEVLLEQAPVKVLFRDLTPGHGATRAHAFETLPDYIDYTNADVSYGLRRKRHDAESLTLSTFSRREDAIVFNPYNPGDQLGVFENTGIESDWRLTLRALPGNPLNTQPQWDRVRDVIFRVWYHAAYERQQGFELAEVVEPQAIRRASRKVLSVSLYRDFYDEFDTLMGDYDPDDPASLAAVRSFTDQSHPGTNGWIEFTIDAALLPLEGQRISAALLAFTSREPSVFPNYRWQLRRGATGAVFDGTSVGDAGALAGQMSAAAPAGFGALDPRGDWFFRMVGADNAGLSLGPIEDIELILEFEPQ
jgi:hypothetical protein